MKRTIIHWLEVHVRPPQDNNEKHDGMNERRSRISIATCLVKGECLGHEAIAPHIDKDGRLSPDDRICVVKPIFCRGCLQHLVKDKRQRYRDGGLVHLCSPY